MRGEWKPSAHGRIARATAHGTSDRWRGLPGGSCGPNAICMLSTCIHDPYRPSVSVLGRCRLHAHRGVVLMTPREICVLLTVRRVRHPASMSCPLGRGRWPHTLCMLETVILPTTSKWLGEGTNWRAVGAVLLHSGALLASSCHRQKCASVKTFDRRDVVDVSNLPARLCPCGDCPAGFPRQHRQAY